MAEPAIFHKARPLIQRQNEIVFDIIIPFHGQHERLCRLIESINRTVRQPHHICLVDDASTNSHFAKIAEVSKLHVVRNERHSGFGASVIAGYNATSNPLVAVVHSDVIVTQGCFSRMMETLQKLQSKKVALVSARSDNPGEGMDPRLIGKHGVSSEDIILEDGFVPFYCAMFLRSLWPRIKSTVKPYFPVGYEDEEFAYRMRRFGFKQAICGSAWVQHAEGATVTALCKSHAEMKGLIEANRDFCLQDIQKLYS